MWMSSLSLEQNHTHTVKSEHYNPCLYLPSLQPNNHMKQIPLILQGETPFATNLGSVIPPMSLYDTAQVTLLHKRQCSL